MAEIAVAVLLGATFFMKKAFRKHCFALSVLIFVAIVPNLASAEKRILIEVSKAEKTSFKRLTAGSQSSGTEDVNIYDARIWGKILDIGRENNVDGRMHMVNNILPQYLSYFHHMHCSDKYLISKKVGNVVYICYFFLYSFLPTVQKTRVVLHGYLKAG